MQQTPDTLGLYLSVPFCRAKCSFCNFASGVGSAEAVERYVELLCREIRGVRRAAELRGAVMPPVVDSIYLGGGTPSLLLPGQIERVFADLRHEFRFGEDVEVTLEAAPGQIADASLESALQAGVNRVSLGVQSFVDCEAQAVGRSHTEASCLAEIRRLQGAGVRNVGVDLIAGLPHQTCESWERSLDVSTACGLTHLSVYMLEVDEESRLGREVLGGGARLHAPAVPSDELTAELYERACQRLADAGYEQYEISNFARTSTRSTHNLKYWLRKPYLGLGLDAHSMLFGGEGAALRWANPDELSDYTGEPNLQDAEAVNDRAAFEEEVFLRLRLNEGLAWSALRDHSRKWREDLRETSQVLARDGLMGVSDERVWLTMQGRLLSSEVFGELLASVST